MHIETVIFDLGGVIIDIDPEQSLREFSKISSLDVPNIQKSFEDLQVFERYESGQLTDEEFLALLRSAIQLEAEDHVLIKAWNALLGAIPAHKIEVIKKLTSSHQVLLLSNTNAIHYKEVENILYRQHGISTFKDLMQDTVLSYMIKMRKPKAEIYTYVLDTYGLNAERTLFIDDGMLNVEGARSVGIRALYYPVGVGISDLLGHAF